MTIPRREFNEQEKDLINKLNKRLKKEGIKEPLVRMYKTNGRYGSGYGGGYYDYDKKLIVVSNYHSMSNIVHEYSHHMERALYEKEYKDGKVIRHGEKFYRVLKELAKLYLDYSWVTEYPSIQELHNAEKGGL